MPLLRGNDGVLTGNPDTNPTDLNKDGQTDLVDLQDYANSRAKINENADVQALQYLMMQHVQSVQLQTVRKKKKYLYFIIVKNLGWRLLKNLNRHKVTIM